MERKWKKSMWIGIPILLPRRFYKVLFLRKYVAWFWLPLVEQASWIHRIFKIWCHNKKKIKKIEFIVFRHNSAWKILWCECFIEKKVNNYKLMHNSYISYLLYTDGKKRLEEFRRVLTNNKVIHKNYAFFLDNNTLSQFLGHSPLMTRVFLYICVE